GRPRLARGAGRRRAGVRPAARGRRGRARLARRRRRPALGAGRLVARRGVAGHAAAGHAGRLPGRDRARPARGAAAGLAAGAAGRRRRGGCRDRLPAGPGHRPRAGLGADRAPPRPGRPRRGRRHARANRRGGIFRHPDGHRVARARPIPDLSTPMFRKPLPLAVLALALAACQPQSSAPAADAAPAPDAATAAQSASQADAAFAALSKEWLDGWLRLNPVDATQVGDHSHDDQVDDLGPEGRKATVEFNRAILARLDAIDASALSRENQVDALILRNQVEGDIWNVETLQSWAWDPQGYSGLAGGAIYGLMARE